MYSDVSCLQSPCRGSSVEPLYLQVSIVFSLPLAMQKRKRSSKRPILRYRSSSWVLSYYYYELITSVGLCFCHPADQPYRAYKAIIMISALMRDRRLCQLDAILFTDRQTGACPPASRSQFPDSTLQQSLCNAVHSRVLREYNGSASYMLGLDHVHLIHL